MNRLRSVALCGALLASACGAGSKPDHQQEWQKVMQQKAVAASPAATQHDKQVYADSLAAFVRKHPDHGHARQVYRKIQVEFADELTALGRYSEAIRFYRGVLEHDPANQQATVGLRNALEHMTVTREKLLTLQVGMSQREVAHVLGKPLPGWTSRTESGAADAEAWYYRTASGGVAAVYFRDGKLLAAEENSQRKTSDWNG